MPFSLRRAGRAGLALTACTAVVALTVTGIPAIAQAAADTSFSSGNADYDAAYAKAISNISDDVVNGTFIAGQNWAQIWTRDSSFSTELGASLIRPTESVATMRTLTEQDSQFGEVWAQDVCGHFGGWPNLSDAIVGAIGVWSTYLATGDRNFLNWGFDVTRNSLERARRDAYEANSGLFRGVATFMESNSAYPPEYAFNGDAAGHTKSLAVNVLYYRAYQLVERFGQVLNRDSGSAGQQANNLKNAINNRLWLGDKGYYAYYEDANGNKSDRMEGLGEALAVLWNVADPDRARSVLANTPTTSQGLPSLWPQFPQWKNYDSAEDSDYYHNGMVWPFVQAYWGWAASQNQNVGVFSDEFAKMLTLSQKDSTFREFYRPEDGTPDGSPRQLWSASGYLSMVYHGLFGMNIEDDGITFKPVVPDNFHDLDLHGIVYRGGTFDVAVHGSGTQVTSFTLDGNPRDDHKLPSDGASGHHEIVINLGG